MEGRTPSEEMRKSRFWTEKASREEMESGVVVFDKRRREVVMGLVLTGQLNTKVSLIRLSPEEEEEDLD